MTRAVSTDAPTVPGPRQGQWTYDDWEALPDDGKRYDVIDGVLYVTTAPSFFHQWIIQRLVRYIAIPAKDQGLAFSGFAPIGVIMPGCDPVQPDFVVVLAARASIIRTRRIRGVPDLIVEIQSPGNAAYDAEEKLQAYARAGLPEYAIVAPETRTLSHYQFGAPGRYAKPRIYQETEHLSGDCLPTISVLVSNLFTGSPDTTLR